jgi:pimeloyl-ACP methyl ester carboxylesterase
MFLPMTFGASMRGMLFLLLMLAASSGPAAPARADAGVPPLPCLTSPPLTTGAYLEARVHIERGDVTLAGRMLVPNRPGPHPAVVILAGGGRDSQVNYTPRFIATRLARCGIAALIYDKRGTGLSGGVWERTTFDDLIDDAVAALDHLRADPRIDAARTGLIGISQGGRLAPVAAARAGGVAFLAAASPPFVSPRETRLFALENLFARRGYAPYWRTPFLTLWRDFLTRLENGDPLHPLDRRREELASYLPESLLPPPSSSFARSPLYNSLASDYSEELRTVKAPFFVIYGACDALIPVEASLARLREALPPDAPLDVVIVPEVDHAFRYEDTARPRFRFEEAVIAWTLSQAGLGEACGESSALAHDGGECTLPPAASSN